MLLLCILMMQQMEYNGIGDEQVETFYAPRLTPGAGTAALASQELGGL